MHPSLWSDHIVLPKFQKLSGNIKTDVLVIGGGICGILCTYFLKQAGISCVLVEQQRIAHGTTGYTTAKITSQHGLIYYDLMRRLGKENAQKYLEINETAIDRYEMLCRDIDCDFQRLPAYTYSKQNARKIEHEVRARNELGASAKLLHTSPLPFSIAGAVGVEHQAQFHPLKFIAHLSKDLNIYENTRVRQLTSHGAICDEGTVCAENIIVATHFPFLNRHGSYYLKLYQHRSYVLAIEHAQEVEGMYADEAEDGLSFRNSNHLLLLGGCGQRTGKPCGNWETLTTFCNQYYPDATIQYQWATQDCMSLDHIPYIGQYSKRTPNVYVATGFNKWGMTSSMVSAMILCDLIQNKDNAYADVFSPSRSILKPQLLINGIETVSNFAHPTFKRCPHLGCALKWNKAEHTWDCSCHGSRFAENGALLNNPATKDVDLKKKPTTNK